MKLDVRQIEAIEKQTGFKPLPDDAAAESGLAEVFGDQTFYVDPNGIYVFEPVKQPSGAGEPMMAIQIAEVERAAGSEGGGEGESPGGNGRSGAEVIVSAVEPRTTSLVVDLAA